MKTADLYIRVSTDEQADKGYSQRSQEEVLRKYCNVNQLQVGRVIFEDHSAKTFNRPEWGHLLLDLKKRKSKTDLILFTKWDRFSRNAGDAYQMISILRKLGIEPQAIEQPLDLAIPENKIMLAFYLAAPEVENDRRALNVTFGMRRARKEGRWMGPAPFGYVNKITELGRKYIEPKYPEAAIVKWMFEEILKRRQSVRSIWREARKKGLRCCKNNIWTIIRNPVYCGKIFVSKYKDEDNVFVQGQHEGIITERLFQEVQDVLDNKRRIYKSKKDSGDLQLRGHLLCPVCGKILTGSTSRGSTKRYTYYHCTSPCKTRFRADEANERFLVELKKYVPRPSIAELFVNVCDDLLKQRTKVQREDLKAIRQELEKESSRLAKARDLLLNSDLEPTEYKTIKAATEINIAKLERKLFDSGRLDPKTGELSDKVFKVLSGVDGLYEKGDVKVKNQMISSIFPEKLIFDGMHYRTTRVNEAVELIYKLGKGFSENKNGQIGENFDLSSTVIIDVYSRKIVGWGISNSLTAQWCKTVLEEAISKYCNPEIVNSDQGTQYTSALWTQYLEQMEIQISMDGKGRALDNIWIERFWKSIKYNYIYLNPADDGLELYEGVQDHIAYYNNKTHHTTKQTPNVRHLESNKTCSLMNGNLKPNLNLTA